MQTKFRFYVVLVSLSGLVFVVLYKTLNEVGGDNSMPQKYEVHKPEITGGSSASGSLKNINALMLVTQPIHHIQKQKMKEAELHAKIRQTSMQRDYRNRISAAGLKSTKFDQGSMEDVIIREAQQHSTAQGGIASVASPFTLKNIVVHLDLKGAPPQFSYYKKLFPLLKSLGATGLLMEYEDMFPYWGMLETLPAHNAYTKEEIAGIVRLARENGLEIIPLIQTFGHMEFILKQKKYEELREVASYPQVICPSHNISSKLIKEMVDQIVILHPHVRWLHIGSDEVYYIGECQRCISRMEHNYLDKNGLFLEHVKSVAKYIKDTYRIQPLMWDDMFRNMPDDIIGSSEIWKYVEIVVWQYEPESDLKLTPAIWEKYGFIFPAVWAASAFKGASGPIQIMPNISYHLQNHETWLRVFHTYQSKVNFRGIMLTGWQRYDHFASLCELFPVGLPSLAINVQYLIQGSVYPKAMSKAREVLGCRDNLTPTASYTAEEIQCVFPGSKIFHGIQRLLKLRVQLDKLFNNNHVIGWMSDYHVQTGFSSPAHVDIGTQNLDEILTNATLLYTYMQNVMHEVYDKYTIHEWLHSFLDPIFHKLHDLQVKSSKLLQNKVWPRRPLKLDEKGGDILAPPFLYTPGQPGHI